MKYEYDLHTGVHYWKLHYWWEKAVYCLGWVQLVMMVWILFTELN